MSKCRECDEKAKFPIKTPSYCAVCAMCSCQKHRRAIVDVDKPKNQVIAGPKCHYCPFKREYKRAAQDPLPTCRECKTNTPTVPVNAPTICGTCQICPICRVRKRAVGQMNDTYVFVGKDCDPCRRIRLYGLE
jgi:hypothetical protein